MPERVAADKLAAELADRIVAHGRLSFSDVRDAISRNQLKLPDLVGDELLRLDKHLFLALDGVYHRAEFYFRWLQTFASLFFGTPWGRWLTLYLALPFGGAFVLVAFGYYLTEEIGLLFDLIEKKPEQHEGVPLNTVNVTLTAGLGLILFGLLHWPAMRKAALHLLQGIGRGIVWLMVRVSGWADPARRHRDSRPPLPSRPSYIVESLVLGIVVWTGCWLFRVRGLTGFVIGGIVTLVALVMLNTAFGRWWSRITRDILKALGQFVWSEVLARVGRLIVDLFKGGADFLEAFFYRLDEHIRFRHSDRRVWLALKAVAALALGPIIYLVRFVVLLLIEPQINPLKHFPTVTVGHKLLLPTIPLLAGYLMAYHALHEAEAYGLATAIITGIPGLFGFMVWEMTSNWRLYKANRPPTLRPVRVGDHGESVPGLLRPGIHSGTVPKLFARWRRAKERGDDKRARLMQERLHHVIEEVRRFVARELIRLLRDSPGWGRLALAPGDVQLSTQRIRIAMEAPELGEPLRLDLEEHAGRLVSAVSEAGWLPQLSPRQRRVFDAALLGWYKLAGVAAVRQRPEQPPRAAADLDRVAVTWADWVAFWQADAAGREPEPLPGTSVLAARP